MLIAIGILVFVGLLVMRDDVRKTQSFDSSDRLELPCGCVAKMVTVTTKYETVCNHEGYWSRCADCKRAEKDFNKFLRKIKQP